jgi:protein-histidine N-methyltransferase
VKLRRTRKPDLRRFMSSTDASRVVNSPKFSAPQPLLILTMSFSFAFGGDDIENEDGEVDGVARQVQQIQLQDTMKYPAKRLDFREALASLPSQVSYNRLLIEPPSWSYTEHDSGNQRSVYRRSLYDIRAQLMAEANVEENDNDDLLAGLDTGDLASGTYEGGFKTWECSIDLAGYLAGMTLDGDWHVIELGAGSAIPACSILRRKLQRPSSSSKLHFTLCDYNEDVLKLCTAPNMFLNAHLAIYPPEDRAQADQDFDLEDIDTGILVDRLASSGITVNMISGEWSKRFVELVLSESQDTPRNLLVLASETIYSPDSLLAFSEALIALLHSNASSAKALIAAKKIYFGVGGGVDEFVQEIQKRGATVKILSDVSTAGVGRVILEVSLDQHPPSLGIQHPMTPK